MAHHSVDSVCERGRLPMKLVVVSNRVVEGSARGAIPGGLAAALVAAVAESGGTWVGGSGKLLNPSDELRPTGLSAARTTTLGAGTLLKVDLPAVEYRRFYNGMANGALWPILHYRPDLVRYEPDYFTGYRAINEVMADHVRRVVDSDSAVWVHDYHFFMLGKFLRERRVGGPLGFFLHTPFPPRSVVMCLPRHKEILQSLSAYDLVGFQTSEDAERFQDYAVHELSAAVIGRNELRIGERRFRIGVFPIGIDVDRVEKAAAHASGSEAIERLSQRMTGRKLVIGVDRLDYSKGLVRRFLAYRHFLTEYPEERRQISFLQITPPTRSEVDAYRSTRGELASLAGDINARFGNVEWVPLRYINEGISPEVLAGYYRAAKIGCVTPLRDGMNLVAKEYVAAQDPSDPGVLVLSIFAGAAKELSTALLVNPYDMASVAERLREAIHMPREERIERWSSAMQTLRKTDVHIWFRSFLAALRATSITTAPFPVRTVA
jgi:trehalose 6-phosphate synthase